jgi:hypothetical protein
MNFAFLHEDAARKDGELGSRIVFVWVGCPSRKWLSVAVLS